MKKTVLICLVLVFSAFGDDVDRLESIVKDIQNLRIKYDKTQEGLDECRYKLKDEQQKNSIIQQELNSLHKLLKAKNKEIAKLKKGVVSKKSVEISQEQNSFPKLQMKIQKFKASAFRLNKDADIYDAVGGEKIDRWEGGRSFTSGVRTKDYVKITGYFVDRKWRASQKEMWVRAVDANKRD